MGFQGGPSRPGITYSCCTKHEKASLTQLIDKFAHLHHLAVQLHPERCKKRQMWYLASCQDTSFFLKVRHTSLAALSQVLLSATTLLLVLKMPFSNMVKEEGVIEGENSNFFQVLTKRDSCPFYLTLLSRAACNPCRLLMEVFFYQSSDRPNSPYWTY